MGDVLIIALTVWLAWYATAGWRTERAARKQAEWDAWIDEALAHTETETDPHDDRIYQQLCFERWEADFR